MGNISYKSIYIKEFLNELKIYINLDNLEKEKETDLKMYKVIEEFFFSNNGRFIFEKNQGKCDETNERIFCTLILYYMALYHDNLELLNKLLESGYSFGKDRRSLNLGMLDKRISSQFDIEVLKKIDDVIKSFYSGLYKKCRIEDYELDNDTVIQKFCYLVNHELKFVLSEKKLSKSIFVKDSICYFGEELIINSSFKQRSEIISREHRFDYSMTKDDYEKVKILMIEHNLSTGFGGFLVEFLKNFTEEELLIMDKANIRPFDFTDFYTLKVDYKKAREMISEVSKNGVNNVNTGKKVKLRNKRFPFTK